MPDPAEVVDLASTFTSPLVVLMELLPSLYAAIAKPVPATPEPDTLTSPPAVVTELTAPLLLAYMP